jgi:glucosamine--fructose-6-phosphate aminotransferase (isomerizing)
MTRIPVEVDLASEFRYRDPIVDDKTLMIIISQSGETADTLAALREGKKRGARILSIVNVVGSSIANESDDVLYTWAGPEIAVATTKGYTTQLAVFYMFAIWAARLKGSMPSEEIDKIQNDLLRLPELISETLLLNDKIKGMAKHSVGEDSLFFIGRNIDYAVALEASLKLKEISYIHSEAYAAGELKHGTISLIEEGTLVAAVATQQHLYAKTVSNMVEVKARGAFVLAVTIEGNHDIEKVADYVIYIPKTHPMFANSLAIIPLQLFGYYVAVGKGCDVDKPRNLAKSVTVE